MDQRIRRKERVPSGQGGDGSAWVPRAGPAIRRLGLSLPLSSLRVPSSTQHERVGAARAWLCPAILPSVGLVRRGPNWRVKSPLLLNPGLISVVLGVWGCAVSHALSGFPSSGHSRLPKRPKGDILKGIVTAASIGQSSILVPPSGRAMMLREEASKRNRI